VNADTPDQLTSAIGLIRLVKLALTATDDEIDELWWALGMDDEECE
jgi:hypothetical protein